MGQRAHKGRRSAGQRAPHASRLLCAPVRPLQDCRLSALSADTPLNRAARWWSPSWLQPRRLRRSRHGRRATAWGQKGQQWAWRCAVLRDCLPGTSGRKNHQCFRLLGCMHVRFHSPPACTHAPPPCARAAARAHLQAGPADLHAVVQQQLPQRRQARHARQRRVCQLEAARQVEHRKGTAGACSQRDGQSCVRRKGQRAGVTLRRQRGRGVTRVGWAFSVSRRRCSFRARAPNDPRAHWTP